MRFSQISLLAEVDSEYNTDEMGNPYKEVESIDSGIGKLTQWTLSDKRIDGTRTYDETDRKLIVRGLSQDTAHQADIAIIDGDIPMKIIDVIDGGRWTIYHVKNYEHVPEYIQEYMDFSRKNSNNDVGSRYMIYLEKIDTENVFMSNNKEYIDLFDQDDAYTQILRRQVILLFNLNNLDSLYYEFVDTIAVDGNEFPLINSRGLILEEPIPEEYAKGTHEVSLFVNSPNRSRKAFNIGYLINQEVSEIGKRAMEKANESINNTISMNIYGDDANTYYLIFDGEPISTIKNKNILTVNGKTYRIKNIRPAFAYVSNNINKREVSQTIYFSDRIESTDIDYIMCYHITLDRPIPIDELAIDEYDSYANEVPYKELFLTFDEE